jgi:hypothetical protein
VEGARRLAAGDDEAAPAARAHRFLDRVDSTFGGRQAHLVQRRQHSHIG